MVSEIFTFKVIVSTVLRLLLVIIESICDGVNISEVKSINSVEMLLVTIESNSDDVNSVNILTVLLCM